MQTNRLLQKLTRIFFLYIWVHLFSINIQAQQNDLYSKSFIKSTMLKVAGWQMQHPNGKPENTWTNGAFYTGVYAAYKTTKTKWLLDSMLAMGNRNSWLPAKRFDHADDLAISQTYIDLYRRKKDRGMILATIDSAQKLMRVSGDQVKRGGITWWWCDALFMAPPTLAKLSRTLGDSAYLNLSDSFFVQCYNRLYDKEEKLFARDASYLIDAAGNGKRESNGKKVFWSRGNGWVVAGLARLLEEMPASHPTRNFYLELFQQMAARLITLQQTDGLWRTSLLDPAAFPGGEASGTAFNCYAMAWGVNQGILDRNTYLSSVKKAWEGLNTLVKSDGKIGWVQPIGADPKRNFNAESWEAYGAGAYLLAASEIIKLKK